MVLALFDDKKDSERKVSGDFNNPSVMNNLDSEEVGFMRENSIQGDDLENKAAGAEAELAKIMEQLPQDDLLKQMGETLVARVGQMSQLALKLLGG